MTKDGGQYTGDIIVMADMVHSVNHSFTWRELEKVELEAVKREYSSKESQL